jgi:hypothetical protein
MAEKKSTNEIATAVTDKIREFSHKIKE